MRKNLIAFCLVLLSVVAYSKPYTAVDQVPRPNRYDAGNFVSNPDRILDSRTTAQLNRIINDLESETKAETAVVVLSSIGDNDINDFAVRLFRSWGIGKSGADNGLLILFVLDQRKVRFETGYGLEGVLPDAICSRIIRENMIPHFKEGDYNAGMLSGMERTASILREEPVALPEKEEIDWGVALPPAVGAYLLLALISLMWMRNMVGAIRKNPRLTGNIARYNALKRQKAGVTSIMAFIVPLVLLFFVMYLLPSAYILLVIPAPFMVIPANIYAKMQMRRIRRQPITCDVCGGKMHLLSEADEDKYLNLSQQFEEQLSAVDYDVFLCDSCENTLILTLDKPSEYSKCPRCGTKAFIKSSTRTTVPPTYISTGVEQTTYKCKFCGYEEHKNTRLPHLQRTSGAGIAGAVIAGSILRGGGGGGGFGGGGSFGGGRSGGGGATGSW